MEERCPYCDGFLLKRKCGEPTKQSVDKIIQAVLAHDTGFHEAVQAFSLEQACNAWCDQNGFKRESMTAIGRRMRELGYQKSKRRGCIFYLGVQLKAEFTPNMVNQA